MINVNYIKGDIFDSNIGGRKILVHVVNDLGIMGAGIALAIRNKWPIVYDKYKKWATGYITSVPFQLGEVQFVNVERNLVVANMVGQQGIGYKSGKPPVKYDAINSCLKKVAEIAKKYNSVVIGPKFGAGLAHGDWNTIEQLIIKNMCEKDIEVNIYEI